MLFFIMKQKIIETTKARLLVVDLPNGASGLKVSDCKITIDINYGVGNQTYAVPPGNWQLLGKMEEVSEYDAFPLFDRNASTGLYNGFYSPKVALFDLLESEITLANPLGERPIYCLIDYGTSTESFKRFEKDLSVWQAAEEKVFKNPVLLIEIK